MKRSRSVQLALLGSLAALAGCDSEPGAPPSPPVSSSETYTNNHYVPGAGYYHAHSHGWFPLPYNHFMAGRGYYQGGNWAPQPDRSGVAASTPTPDSARLAEAKRQASTPQRATGSSSTRRSGFGNSSRSIFS
jgi:hypothetical protein